MSETRSCATITAESFAVEIKCTRGHVWYLKSIDLSRVNEYARGAFKYFHTRAVPVGYEVPADALRVSRDRAFYLSTVMNNARLITKVVEITDCSFGGAK